MQCKSRDYKCLVVTADILENSRYRNGSICCFYFITDKMTIILCVKYFYFAMRNVIIITNKWKESLRKLYISE